LDELCEGRDLVDQLATAREEMLPEIAFDEEAEERARFAGDSAPPLLPAEREEARRQQRQQQRRECPAAPEPPRQPGLRAPAGGVEHGAGQDLVGGLLLGRAPERADDRRRQPVWDGVQQHPHQRQREPEKERERFPSGPAENEPWPVRRADLGVRAAESL